MTPLAERLFGLLALAGPPPSPRVLADVEALLAEHPQAGWVEHLAFAARGALSEGASAADLPQALRSLERADLAFALACAAGDREAIARLERELIESVPKALVRLRPSAQLVDDVRQALREKLLVAELGTRPKLLDYRGRGPLAAWVRVVAMRIAYTHLRDGQKDDRADDVAAFETLADAADAPDVVHFKTKYAAEVRGAFEEAVAALEPEVRSVLRAHAVEGLSIDQIGALYQVHRATAARWVSHARGTLLDALRASLRRRLGVETAACDSIVALVQSRIDLSMSRLFARED